MIAVSSVLPAGHGIGCLGIGMAWGYLRCSGVVFGLLVLAVAVVRRPSERASFGLFKYASVYMLAAMILVVVGVI